jgi:4-hydroxybenzoate polyprenyltransferase
LRRGEALQGRCRFPFDLRLASGALAYALILLLLRLMDDIKDYETDKTHFKDRLTARSGIGKAELYRAMWVVLGAIGALSLFFGPVARGFLALLVGYAFLMFKYFFHPPIARSLSLAVVTHNPIVPLSQLYALSFLLDRHGPAAFSLGWAPIVGALWMPLLAWEVGRKIRAPEDETAYQTYSLLLGYRGASILLLGVLGLGAAATGWLMARLSLTPLFALVYGSVLLYAAARIASFMRRPASRPAGFRFEAELVVAVTALGCLAALAARCLEGSP